MVDHPVYEERQAEAASAGPVSAARLRVGWREALLAVLLVAIIGFAAYLRFVGQNWDDFTHLHPDERFLTDVVSRLQPVSGIGEYFNTHESGLNPNNRGFGFYVYGTLPLFVVKAASGVVADLARDPAWAGYNGVHLVGRTVSALADLTSLFFIFLIGRRLYNRWVGLLAAALYAGAVLPVQLSHFWTMDAPSTLPVVIAFWFAVRVLDEGGAGNYAGFGVALGAAVASRINVAPLAVVLALAALIRVLPTFDVRYPGLKRQAMWAREGGGLLLAAALSFIVFRVAQPYAFSGPGIFGILPNMDWWQQMQTVRSQVSGQVDFPPNYQWTSRVPYVFSWWNMVMWGMGLPLGLTAWGAWLWAGWRVVRARPNWTRHLLPVVWILLYYGWQGGGWVMSMRYYMPLYPFLILLAAWALVTLVRRAWRGLEGRPAGRARARLALSGGLLAVVAGFTLLWGFAFTRIYTRQLTRVQASHWFLQNVPADYSFTIEAPDGSTHLVNLGLPNDRVTHEFEVMREATRYFQDGQTDSVPFTVPLAYNVAGLSVIVSTEPQNMQMETLWLGLWDAEAERLLREVVLTPDLAGEGAQPDQGVGQNSERSPRRAFQLQFETPFWLSAGRDYALQLRADAGTPFTVEGVAILYRQEATYYGSARTVPAYFTAPISGTVTHVHAAHLGDPLQDPEEERLWVGLWDAQEERLIGEGRIAADFSQGAWPLGSAYDIPLDAPVSLVAGRSYELRTRAEAGAPFIVAGAAIATEGPWDDAVPTKVCAMPPGQRWTPETPPGLVSVHECVGIDGFGMGYYQGLELFMAAEDTEDKRETMLRVLDQADYLTISSNRFYDSLSRLPMRFPLSLRYYEALFSGELGFELVRTFSSSFRIGGLTFPDQVLPTHDAPWWLNEWEAEEAFHVYDHPTVFVFRKTADYDREAVARILGEVALASASGLEVWADPGAIVGVVPWTAPQASRAPTALMLPEPLRQVQLAGGTWSALFDVDSPVNRSEGLAVAAWWGVLVLFGWAAWPTLYALLPALEDRAYPVAKVAGLLVVSWLAWYGASLGFKTWSAGGILALMGGLALLSGALAWRQRAALGAYLRRQWRRLLILEGIALLLFLVFLAIRWGNPDLWHTRFGGEKPMDFAYFNAVLRSTVFPPYNPWYAGGYINYYYFGFVLVGTPVKLLGIVPAVGYNLIMATLFSLTGMGAFSAAFNLAAGLRRRRADGSPGMRLGNPWVAGVGAILLAVVLGNLDELRVLLDGLARAGGGSQVSGGGGPFLPSILAVLQGVGALFRGQALPIDTGWWMWNPTRVMIHTGNAINEIPFFTFLYGDPHAHAIALPLTLLVIVWLLNEVLGAGRVRRGRLEAGLALALGALAVGILRATNFADWVTYLVLSVFGLTFATYLWLRAQRASAQGDPAVRPDIPPPGPAWRIVGLFGGAWLYLGWESFKRLGLTWETVLRWVGQVGGLLLLGAAFLAPFSYWYGTADAVPQLWQGQKTPLWAYFDLNGVFLFLVVSLMAWETARWLKSIRVRQLIGHGALVTMILIGLGWLAAVVLAMVVGGYGIALVALPLVFWAALLFFRAGQPREMRLLMAFIALAIALTLVVDVVVWAGDIGRQNTVFKFYMQVWMLLSVVGGVALAWLLRASAWWRDALRNGWMAMATVLFTIAAMYPLLATQAKLTDRMAADAPRTLDGMAFMQYAVQGEHGEWFPLDEDYHMLRWMQDHIQGTPVILEGQSEREYLWGGRVSVYTGLPAIVGYNWHQRQQRTFDPLPRLVQQRVDNVNWLYNTTDIQRAWRMLRHYDVAYIVVGQLEQAYYSAEGLAKFQRMAAMGLLDLVYEQGETRVYAVRQGVHLTGAEG